MTTLASIIATAIADGGPVADAMSAAERVVAALPAIGPKFTDAVASEPYAPVDYPKWVNGHLVHNAEEEAQLTAPTPAPAAS